MKKRSLIPEGYLDEVFAARTASQDASDEDLVPRPSRPRPVPKPSTSSTRTAAPRRRSRHREAGWGATEVSLGGRQIDFLDSLVRRLRKRGDASADRQGVLRALLDGIDEATIDFSRADSIATLKHLVRTQLATPPLLRLPQTALDASIKFLSPFADLAFGRTTPRRKP